jgi:hypothetical protein
VSGGQALRRLEHVPIAQRLRERAVHLIDRYRGQTPRGRPGVSLSAFA